MKKATKEKKSLNNRNKVNNKKKNRIFDYEQEVEPIKNRQRNKLTRKANSKKKNNKRENYLINGKIEDKELIKNNKKRIRKLQKRTKEENAKRKKLLIREQRKEKRTNNKKIKTKLNYKQIEKMKRISRFIKMILITLLIIGSFLLLVLSPIFYIKEVRVLGNEKISKQEITSLLKVGNETNIFKETESDVKNKLSVNPYIDIEKTTMRRILPEILEVKIFERNVEFLLEFGNSYAYIDENGYVLEISNNNIDDKIKIIGYDTIEEYIKPGKQLCDNDMKKIKDVIYIISVSKNYGINEKITSIDISDSEDYVLYLQSEMKNVHLGNNSAMETKMMYVKAIVEKENGNDGEIFVNVDLNKKNAYFKQNV